MSVTIKEVKTKKDLSDFIEFNYQLYKDDKYSVPDLKMDLEKTFDKNKNAGAEFSDIQLYLAYKDGKLAGRVAAIINHRANETWNVKNVRFGWIDFIDDIEVTKALLDKVEKFGRDHGMTQIQGPLGITDMDNEGMLIDGFDEIGTFGSLYNYPYYPQHLEQLGYVKETDWHELKMDVPSEVPERYTRTVDLVMKRSHVHVKKLNGKKDIFQNGYGQKIFDLVNESYAPLFGYSKMTQRQIDQLIKEYLPMLDLRMISLVETDDTHELVGCGISMPSIVRAMQKSGGKLFPFGWFHLIKSLFIKHEENVELLLIAVRPDYQAKGITSLIFNDLTQVYINMGFKWAETNIILEDNLKNLTQWSAFNPRVHKRRRCFKKEL